MSVEDLAPATKLGAAETAPGRVSGEPTSRPGFPIVGMGASAGALAVVEEFFSSMPAGTGMAFILALHLAPESRSVMSECIQKVTSMKVCEAQNGMAVEPECVYVIPPGREMVLEDGRLALIAPEIPVRMPIDHLFLSLANELGERAICMVLTGGGSDGMLGLKAVKAAGGMAMVQDPASTLHKGMPDSAISTGLADYVLPPRDMPGQLISYVSHPQRQPWSNWTQAALDAGALGKILDVLRRQTGHNFSEYKESTVRRRIEHRLAVNHVDDPKAYIRYLDERPREVDALLSEFLIGVTGFFRDREAFESLRSKVVPELFTGKSLKGTLRVWVPGCSTGEEAYSVAILLASHMDETGQRANVQIFATDIDGGAIDFARAGTYPRTLTAQMPKEYLGRYFTPARGGHAFQIRKTIRDMVVFAQQDLIEDPPFSRLDLISCRNLLIYFDSALQQKVLSLFHYALSRQGFLFLGNSETVGACSDLFTPVDRKHKIYQNTESALHRGPGHRPQSPRRVHAELRGGSGVRALVEAELLRRFAPPCVAVDRHGDILFIHGHTGRYLELIPGEAKMNIFQMAREGLRLPLRDAVSEVLARGGPVRRAGLRVAGDQRLGPVALSVAWLGDRPKGDLVLVTFEEAPAEKAAAQVAAATETWDEDRVAVLERQLKDSEDRLQGTIEDLEVANTELQSANEELQSTNEELETSKEEVQSVNEGLMAASAEQSKTIDELARANSDINNALTGTGVGMIFLDKQLRIQRFTPVAARVVNLIETDIGRPLSHISSNLASHDLDGSLQEVMDTLTPQTAEVIAKDGQAYTVRVKPYRSANHAIEGLVVTFADVTEQVRLQQSDERLSAIVRASRDAIMLLGLDGQISAWNPGAEKLYGWRAAEAIGMNIADLTPEPLRAEISHALGALSFKEQVRPLHTQRICKDGAVVDVDLVVSALVDAQDSAYALAVIERPRAQTILRKRERK